MTPEDCARTIARNIRAELVCCDAYERYAHDPEAAENRGHGLCFWGEAAARVALRTTIAGGTDITVLNLSGRRSDAVYPHWRHLDMK